MNRGIDRSLRPCALAALLLVASLASHSAFAQATTPAPSTTPAPAPAADVRIAVRAFQVNGNSLLTTAALDATLTPFKGERTLDELQQAAAAVQAAYGRAGYGGVVAFLPPQSPTDGTVQISVVEGKLSRAIVSGNKQFSEDNIRAGLPALVPGATPRLTGIDTQIQINNENPAKEVQVLLQPGQEPGQVEARVNVVERPVQRISLGLENTGNDRTGDWRVNVGWQHANLFGRDHVASVQYQTSPEEPKAVQVISGGYRVPFYAQGLVLDAYAAYSDVDGGNTATVAGNLTFNGRGRVFGARLGAWLPRLGEFDQRVAIGLDHRAYLNNCRIEGLPAGACGSAGESVSVQPLFLEYTLQRGGPMTVGVNVGLHHNLQLGGGNSDSAHFEAVRPGARPRYTALRLNAFSGLGFGDDWQLRVRAISQFTNDALVPGEQFGAGGAASVRGYEERELSGDSGATLSVELLSPDIARLSGWGGNPAPSLRFVGFADGGWVKNQRDTVCAVLAGRARDECSIGSLGAGARFQYGDLQARLFVAHAMKGAVRTARNDTRTHVAVSYSF